MTATVAPPDGLLLGGRYYRRADRHAQPARCPHGACRGNLVRTRSDSHDADALCCLLCGRAPDPPRAHEGPSAEYGHTWSLQRHAAEDGRYWRQQEGQP